MSLSFLILESSIFIILEHFNWGSCCGWRNNYLGIFSMASPRDNYTPPLLNEQLLSAHNKIMEKEMIDSYKEGRLSKDFIIPWIMACKQETSETHNHKCFNGLLQGQDLWQHLSNPPLLTEQLLSAHNNIMEKKMIDSYKEGKVAQVASSHQQQQRPNLTEGQSSAAAGSTQAMYSMFPPYYISPHISSNQKPTGGYFVSVPTIFGQQPLQVQAFQGLYHPMDHGLQAGNFRDTQSQIIQRLPSRTGYLATSVKAEPGSDLESNLESNASISASVKTIKILSAGYKRFIATASNRGLPRTSLPDPFWLTNVEMTPQLTFKYQAEPCNFTEILKRDYDFLKKVNQPNQVKEQLAQLYRELDGNSDCNFPFLPVHPVVP